MGSKCQCFLRTELNLGTSQVILAIVRVTLFWLAKSVACELQPFRAHLKTYEFFSICLSLFKWWEIFVSMKRGRHACPQLCKYVKGKEYELMELISKENSLMPLMLPNTKNYIHMDPSPEISKHAPHGNMVIFQWWARFEEFWPFETSAPSELINSILHRRPIECAIEYARDKNEIKLVE